MLVTPLGEIIIFYNDKKIEYKAVSIENVLFKSKNNI